MRRRRIFTTIGLAGLAAMLCAGVAAPVLAKDRTIIVTPPIDLQVQQSRQRAQQYQQLQKIYREQDRRMSSQPQPTPQVPVMRPTCTPTNGVSC